MPGLPSDKFAKMLELNKRVQEALGRSIREARLEHARMGRSVSEWRDGQIVRVSPKEIFAQYGFDGCGRPLQPPQPEPEYYL
jgi:hypothetical protein